MKRSLKFEVFERKTLKSARKPRVNENKWTEYAKKLIKEKIPVRIARRQRKKMQQHDQDNGRGPGLAGYAMWKSDTKSAA